MMEDLRYQSWSLGRQLNAMYETVEKICGVRVTLVKHQQQQQEIRPTYDSDHHQQQLDGLRRQGGLLRQQIQDLIVKLPVRRPQDDHHHQQQQAAEALRHFLVSNGGETGGWDPKDHQLFLQWRSRFRNNRQTFVSAVCDTVPGKNPAQVEAHEKWYQNLQRLRREQRQELDEWKRRKRFLDEEERHKAAQEAQQDPGDTWVAEWRRQRGTVRKQLDRWKEEKAKASEPVVTEEMAEAAQKREQAEQKRRMDQQYQKLIAYLWRMEQESLKMASETADQFVARLSRKEKSQLQTNNFHLMAEQRQQRDQEWLEQRRRQLLTRQQQQQPPRVVLRRSVSVPRDPKRLLRPTSAYIARLLPADNDQSSRPQAAFYVLDIQSKTVPSWRQLSTGS